MYLTKQTARFSTGGKAPRKSLAMFGRYTNNEQENHSIDLDELKKRYQENQWDDRNHQDDQLVKFIESQYKNCDDLVKQWIYSDLLNNDHLKNSQVEEEEILDSSLLQRLDINIKYEIFQFVPTYSIKRSEQSATRKETVQLDSPFMSMLKMRLINKFYNKIMLKKILTLKHLTFKLDNGTLNYFRAICAAQLKYKRNVERDRNYDLDSICLFDLSVTEPTHSSNVFGTPFGLTQNAGNPFGSLVASTGPMFGNNSLFGVTQTTGYPFDGKENKSRNFSGFFDATTTRFTVREGNKCERIRVSGDDESLESISSESTISHSTENIIVKYDSFASAPEDALIGNLFANKSQSDDQDQSTTESAAQYLSEEIDLYSRAFISFRNTPYHESPFNIPYYETPINETVESLTLHIVQYPLISQIIEVCPNLKKLNLIYSPNISTEYGFSFELQSNSLEELNICIAQLGRLFPNNSNILSPLGTNTPKLKSITFSPLIPSQDMPDNLESLFDSIPITTIDKIHIYDKIGRNETQFIKTQYYETSNTPEQYRELKVYWVQHKSFLNLSIIFELIDMYGDFFVENVMPSMLFGYHLNNTQLASDSIQFKSYFIEEFRKYRDMTNHLFRNKKIPIASIKKDDLLTKIFGDGQEKAIRNIKLQYLLYLCNQYQDSTLLNNEEFSAAYYLLQPRFVSFAIHYGWNFTKQSRELLEYFVINQLERGVSSMLKIFEFDEQFIESLLDNNLSVQRSKNVIRELIMHLYNRSPKYLFSMLARNYQIPNSDTPVTIPTLARLFNDIDSYLVCKLINEMDVETFNSIGQNNRGDNILHIFVYARHELEYNIFYCILKKNPNLINMVNHKLQTPLHYLMAGSNRKSQLLIPEIKRVLKSNSDLVMEFDSADYMEQTPRSLFEAQEKVIGDFVEKFSF